MNLRKKIPKEAKMAICEISESRRNQFIQEVQTRGVVAVANSPKEVAEQSVSLWLRATVTPRVAQAVVFHQGPTPGA